MTEQQAIIDKAHEERRRNLKGDVSTLTFFMEPLNDLGIELLSEQRPDLEGLFLMRTQITDAAIPFINRFRDLKELNIEEIAVSGESLSLLDETLPLEKLTAWYTACSPKAATKLATMPRLNYVRLWADHCDNLSQPWDDSVIELAKSKTINNLTVFARLSGSCIPALAQMPALSRLYLKGSQLDAHDLKGLCAIPSLQGFMVTNCSLDDETFASFDHWSDLNELALVKCPITDASMRQIAAYEKLETLWLEDINITEQGCECLRSLKYLKYLECHVQGISSAFLKSLKRHNKKLFVHP